MADITVTAANVRPGSNAITQPKTAGGTITAGDTVYADAADNGDVKRASTATAAAAAVVGIALTNAADSEQVIVQTSGDIDIGGTLVVGEVYVVSDNAGKIRPVADNATGDFVTLLGVADAADNLSMNLQASGTARA